MTPRLLSPSILLAWLLAASLLVSAWGSQPASTSDSASLGPAGDAPGLADSELPGIEAYTKASVCLPTDAPAIAQADYLKAQQLLEALDAPFHRVARLSRPTGSFNLIWYYLKKLAVLLFVNVSKDSTGSGRKIPGPLSEAVQLLESAWSTGHAESGYALADLSFHGKFGYPQNFTRAHELYQDLAAGSGHAGSQHMLGFMHSTGIGEVVEKSQAQSLLYHTFAADAGDVRAQMTVAFKYYAGIGTSRDCEKSVDYYKRVADKAMDYVRSGPPGGRRLLEESHRLADDEGGVYGEGASYSSSGMYARHGLAPDSDQTMDDYLEYLDLMSRKGDLKATFRLGQYHYDGSRALRQDFITAKEFFLDIARRYWSTKDGKIKPDVDRELERLASKAAGYLGSMFLRGEGVEQNFAKARIWFRRGVENGDALCQFSLGLMHLHGLGVQEDAVKASEFFGAAADQDFPMAHTRLGVLHLDQGDVPVANKYFELAARHRSIEAYYFLAELTNQGIGRDRTCTTAALYYKLVAERAESLHSNFADANDLYELGERDAALTLYMQAAEQGYESAQANVAYLLDRTARVYPSLLHAMFPSVFRFTAARVADASLALTYWTRSAKQANVDSLVKMGDYYLSGLGNTPAAPSPSAAQEQTASSSGTPDPDKAAACYSAAAETQMSAQALWNLGWMHENGLGGMARDFHLAKRYYDSALETNAEAYLPVTLALLKLRVRSWWNGVTGGKAKGINAGDPPGRRRTLAEWLAEFLVAELGEQEQLAAMQAADGGAGGFEDGDDGGAQLWANGDDALYDDYDLSDSDFWEAALFALMAAGLAILVWYRRNMRPEQQPDREGEENAAGNNAAQQQDRGMFPAPGDPDFANWAAGGVGH